jgi:hypothetical protein
MSRSDVHGGTQRNGILADRLQNARFRLHMPHRRRRQELPLVEEEDETSSEGSFERNEPPAARLPTP